MERQRYPRRAQQGSPARFYRGARPRHTLFASCLLYTSDAADERSSVDLGGRRIIKKKTKHKHASRQTHKTQKQT